MKHAQGPDAPPCRALLMLLRTADTVWNASRLFFEPWQISPSQFNVLNLLRDNAAGLSQSELSRQLIMHRSNVTGLVDRLEARGLVARNEVAVDRRAYSVVLTAQGSALISRILPHYYAAAARLWAVMPPARLRAVIADLGAVAQNAERIALELEKSPELRRLRSRSRPAAAAADNPKSTHD